MQVTDEMVDVALRAWWILDAGTNLDVEYKDGTGPRYLAKARREMRETLEAAIAYGVKHDRTGQGKKT